MRAHRRLLIAALAGALALPRPAAACTSILVAKGASADGSTFITYAADSHELYGDLPLRPAASHPPGAEREVLEWDTGKRLGRIPQVAATYHVVGHINEHQVAISETTFTGRKELRDPEGKIDYGSLMFLALERARSAREAIEVMTRLVAEHGYASTGESFSISDPGEVWILEMIGKGPKRTGAVWVARRVPDGHVSAHANHARIRQFPLADRDTLYAAIFVAKAPGPLIPALEACPATAAAERANEDAWRMSKAAFAAAASGDCHGALADDEHIRALDSEHYALVFRVEPDIAACLHTVDAEASEHERCIAQRVISQRKAMEVTDPATRGRLLAALPRC